MDYRDAFVLWRGLGIDYEGGVLADPARVAIHVTHRLGAVIAGLTLVAVGLRVVWRSSGGHLRFLGGLLVFAVLLQFSIGVSMVHFGIPLILATLHNAGAAFLVIVNVALLRALRPVPGRSAFRPEVAPAVVPLRRVDPAR
jgi:cytochrome c oxidase assembly protein subunit 15